MLIMNGEVIHTVGIGENQSTTLYFRGGFLLRRRGALLWNGISHFEQEMALVFSDKQLRRWNGPFIFHTAADIGT